MTKEEIISSYVEKLASDGPRVQNYLLFTKDFEKVYHQDGYTYSTEDESKLAKWNSGAACAAALMGGMSYEHCYLKVNTIEDEAYNEMMQCMLKLYAHMYDAIIPGVIKVKDINAMDQNQLGFFVILSRGPYEHKMYEAYAKLKSWGVDERLAFFFSFIFKYSEKNDEWFKQTSHQAFYPMATCSVDLNKFIKYVLEGGLFLDKLPKQAYDQVKGGYCRWHFGEYLHNQFKGPDVFGEQLKPVTKGRPGWDQTQHYPSELFKEFLLNKIKKVEGK